MAEFGEPATWGPLEHLSALAVDVAQNANWQRAGDKNAPRPRPVPRPRTRSEIQASRDRLLEQRRRLAKRKG